MGMMINRRRVMGLLSSRYTQLEYIESTGTQYIDSGILSKQTLKIKAKVYTKVWRSMFVYGVRNGSATITYSTANSVTEYGYIRWGNIGFVAAGISGLAEVEQDSSGVIINGTKYYYNLSQIVTSLEGNTITVFGGNVKGSVSSFLIGKIYYLQIYDNNIVIRNLIPVRRNSDNVVGMYDTVSQTFFTNAGTGTFIAGPEV